MSKLQPSPTTRTKLAIEYAELMEYTKLKHAYKTHAGRKLTIPQIGKLLSELNFIVKVKNKCILNVPRIYQFNSYLHTKIHKPSVVGEQIRILII